MAQSRGNVKTVEIEHWSDCAVHSEPAYPAGPCDCGGFIMVPREPTEAMIEAGIAQANECTDNFSASAACVAEHVYRAMISALEKPQ